MPRILCSAVLSTLAFCMGCQDSAPQAGPGRPSGLPVSLLFAPDGSEYASPSDELRSRSGDSCSWRESVGSVKYLSHIRPEVVPAPALEAFFGVGGE